MFAQKFGLTIGAGLAGWMLALFGYQANVAQSEESLTGIRLMFTLVPASVSLLNVAALLFYSLSDSDVERIGQRPSRRPPRGFRALRANIRRSDLPTA